MPQSMLEAFAIAHGRRPSDADCLPLGNDAVTKFFLAGAVWGMQAAKLSQAEIAAITAAVATKKDKR